MIPDRLRDIILAIGGLPEPMWRAAYQRLSDSDRAALTQLQLAHDLDDHVLALAAALEAVPRLSDAFDRLSEADQDRIWAMTVWAMHPPHDWSREDRAARAASNPRHFTSPGG